MITFFDHPRRNKLTDPADAEAMETQFLAKVISVDVDRITVKLLHKIRGERYFIGNSAITATLRLSPEAAATILDVTDDGKTVITVGNGVVTSMSRPIKMTPSPRFVSIWKPTGLEIIASNELASETAEKINTFKQFGLVHDAGTEKHTMFAGDFVTYTPMDCGCCTKIDIGYTAVCTTAGCAYKFVNVPQRLLVWSMFSATKVNPQFTVSVGDGLISVTDVQTGFKKGFKQDELLHGFIDTFVLPLTS